MPTQDPVRLGHRRQSSKPRLARCSHAGQSSARDPAPCPSPTPFPQGKRSRTPFTDGETEARRGEMTCSTSPRQALNPGVSTPPGYIMVYPGQAPSLNRCHWCLGTQAAGKEGNSLHLRPFLFGWHETVSLSWRHLSRNITFEKDSVVGKAGGRAFHAAGTACAKALRQHRASCAGGTVWRPVWLNE